MNQAKSRHYQPDVVKAMKDTKVGTEEDGGTEDRKKKGTTKQVKQGGKRRSRSGKNKGKGRGKGKASKKRKANADEGIEEEDLFDEDEAEEDSIRINASQFL